MAEVPFRPVRQLSEYKGKGASASREKFLKCDRSNEISKMNQYIPVFLPIMLYKVTPTLWFCAG